MVSVTASFSTASPSKAFLKPYMPPTVVCSFRAKAAFAPEGLVTMLSDYSGLRDIESRDRE